MLHSNDDKVRMNETKIDRAIWANKWMRAAGVGALMLCMGTQQSWAWGHEGHRLTALVAEQYLTPETRAQIAELLKKETIVDVASWADSYRSEHPETGKWHFVDIPKADAKFDRNRDCPVSETDPKSPWRDCVTDRILYFEGRLGDTALDTEQRAMALKFVVHLIGDIHQPFHALGDDRGGNGIAVNFMGSSQCGSYNCNLHAVWDEEIIESQGLNEKKYTDRLLQEIKDNHWERMDGGEPTMWANISHHYAVEAMAPNGALLTHEYVAAEAKVVDAQLALGGLRLARVLNRILGTPAVSATEPGRTPLPKAPATDAPPAPAAPATPATAP
jgi:hypothetical protein